MNARTERRGIALSDAVERDRLVARISRKVGSELDLGLVLDTTVTDIGVALGVERAFVRLGSPGETMRLAAEWHAEGIEPIGTLAERLPVSNLAAREGRTIAIADAATAPELDDSTLGGRETLLGIGTHAVLAAPIVVFGQLIGVLGLHRTEPGGWVDEEIRLAEAVAREVGLAIHMARLLDENRRRLRQATALFGAAQVVTSDLRLESVLQRLVREVTGLLQADAADCYLYDAGRATLRCTAVFRLDPSLVEAEFPADQGLAGEALRRRRCVYSQDYAGLPTTVPHPAYEAFASSLVAPMMWADETRGVLGVATRDRERVFTDADAEILEAFASLASLALRNAASFEESERQTRIQRAFYRIAAVLGEPLSRAETMDAVAQAAAEALGGSSAAVLVPRGGTLALAGAEQLPERLATSFAEGRPAFGSVLAAASRDRRLLASRAIAEDDRFDADWRALMAESGIASALVVPLNDSATADSALVLVFFHEGRSFTDEDLDLARYLAGAAEGALERSRMFEAERRSRALAQQLAGTGSLLAAELDPSAVLEEVVQHAPALVGADACAIRVLEGDELVVRAAAGDETAGAVGKRSPASGWLAGDVVQARGPIAVEAALADGLGDVDPIVAAGYEGYLGVPLTGPEGGIQGVLSVYARAPRVWREDETDALMALAANASATLSNAELYQRVAVEKERSETILANIADGIVATDREGGVVLWNAAAERITGVPQSEALGRTPAQVLQRDLSSSIDAPLGDRIVSITRGGEDVWLSLTEAVMRDPAGAVAGRVFAFRDISAEHQVEQMKSDFVSTVSHELRRPLTSIYGFAATLLRHDLLFGEDERRMFLNYIASESERLTNIVDSLLAVARLDSGDLQLRLGRIDVASVVSAVVARAEEREDNGHRFVVDVPDDALAVRADRDSLDRVLSHLVDNAVRYSPAGSTVTVLAREKSDTVEVRVVDEGVGIPQSEQQRIFTKFYRRAHGAGTGDHDGGPGLSLFISRALIAAMNGRIWVTSAEGKGSSFIFELPLA